MKGCKTTGEAGGVDTALHDTGRAVDGSGRHWQWTTLATESRTEHTSTADICERFRGKYGAKRVQSVEAGVH